MTEHYLGDYSSYLLLTELEKKFVTKDGQLIKRSSSGNDNNSSPGQSPGPLAQNRLIRKHFPRSKIVAPLVPVSILETERYTNDARRSLQQAHNLAAIRRHAVPRTNQAPSPRPVTSRAQNKRPRHERVDCVSQQTTRRWLPRW